MSNPNNLGLFAANLAINSGNVVVPINQGGTGGANAVVALNNMSYLSSSSNAIARSATAKFSDWVSILDFGGDNTGTNDNSAALSAALASFVGYKLLIFFPPGKYKFNSQVTLTMPNSASGSQATAFMSSITLLGMGADVTELYWPTGSGLSVVFSSQQHSIHVRDLSFTTGAQNSGNAITLTQNYPYFGTFVAQSDFTNVTFRGADGYAYSGGAGGKYWTQGVNISNVSDIIFQGCNFYGNSNGNVGTGIYLSSPGAGTFVSATEGLSSSFTIASVITIEKCNFSFIAIGVYYGANIQTVTIANSFFGNGQNAVVCPANLYNNSNQGFIFSNNTCFCTLDAITIQSPLNNIQIIGNFFAVSASYHGIFISPSVNTTIVGNQFIPYGSANTAAAGIELQGFASGSIQSIDITAVGSGYTNGSSATVSGGGGSGLAVTIASVNGSGGITSLSISNRGTGYTSAPTISFSGGSSATFRVNLVSTNLTLINANTFSSVTNGIILDNNSQYVTVGPGNSFTPTLTNAVLNAGTNNFVYATSGVGYATGSGGSVTQSTNKTTGVTINTYCGQIVTANSTLGNVATNSFTVTNNKMASTDVVMVNATNGNYTCVANNNSNGSFNISLTNVSGGSLSDVVYINFAIFKASNS